MNEFKINSKILNYTLTFTRPSGYYIYCDNGKKGREGVLGYQICKGGYLNMGSTIGYGGSNQKEFEKICKNWYKKYTHLLREGGVK